MLVAESTAALRSQGSIAVHRPRAYLRPGMRLLLAFLTFVALLVAPLGVPASAMTSEHCTEMGAAAHGDEGEAAVAKDKSCCTAVSAALPQTAASEALDLAPELRIPRPLAELPLRLGDVEVPPPRP